MFSIVELKTTTLDIGIPGVSPIQMLLFFAMMLAISMIPYLFLFVSLRNNKDSMSPGPSPILAFTAEHLRRLGAWIHVHRHPVLHH